MEGSPEKLPDLHAGLRVGHEEKVVNGGEHGVDLKGAEYLRSWDQEDGEEC